MELGTGTLLERGASGDCAAVAVLEIPGLCQSGRTRLNREPVSSSEGYAQDLNRWPSWAEMPGVGEWPGSLEVW